MNIIYKEKQDNAKSYSGSTDYIKTDCPNQGDFELVQKNLKRVMKIQENFWKEKQEKNNPELYNSHKWRLN